MRPIQESLVQIFLDDDPRRIPDNPDEWVIVRSVEEAIAKCEEIGLANVTKMSLDHDLGHPRFTGMYFAHWIVEQWLRENVQTFHPGLDIRVHSMNPVGAKNMASLLYSNNGANPLYPNSFQDAFDNGTNFPSYGGISRTASGNSSFQGQYINATSFNTAFGTLSPASVGFTRKTMASLIARVTDAAGGESPTYIVMSPGDYATLNNDFIGVEQQFVTPGRDYSMDTAARSSFPNINVSGIPIFADHFVPAGNVFGANCKYTAMYMSEDAAFDFSGFYSLVPLGQIGQQGVVVLGYNVVTAKSVSGFWCYGVTNAQF
jgi:hypothetical protein